MRKRFVSIVLVILITVTAISLNAYSLFSSVTQDLMNCLQYSGDGFIDTQWNMKRISGDIESNMEMEIENKIPFKINLIKLNGKFLRVIGNKSYYDQQYSMSITDSGYVVNRYDKTSTDYEFEQILELKEYLDSKGINLLYVNEPMKYIDDEYYINQFGRMTYGNKNTDTFLERIENAGIEYIDLRDNIVNEGKEPLKLFYRTDHHWTVPTSKWAASIIANQLNEKFDYNIDMKLFNSQNYNYVEYTNCWLGEQGRLVADTYVGMDDYVMMEPNFQTEYKIIDDQDTVQNGGDFGIFIKKYFYDSLDDKYTGPLYHYSYNAYNGFWIHNDNSKVGRVLLLGDSYEQSMAPFLSLGIRDMKVVCLRDDESGKSVREIIDNGNFDTVIIAYAQFMIGAHDDEDDANYDMFNFE